MFHLKKIIFFKSLITSLWYQYIIYRSSIPCEPLGCLYCIYRSYHSLRKFLRLWIILYVYNATIFSIWSKPTTSSHRSLSSCPSTVVIRLRYAWSTDILHYYVHSMMMYNNILLSIYKLFLLFLWQFAFWHKKSIY